MGYSCTAIADLVLREMMEESNTESSNTWVNKGNIYFYDVGKENEDGAITGTVYRITKDGNCKRSGSFRIEGSGIVKRFPCISKPMKARAMATVSDVLVDWS